MAENNPIDAEALLKEAQTDEHREAYKLLLRTRIYRIGVGARADPPTPAFFVEIIISLSPDSNEVDLTHLEKTLNCLKTLQAQKYTLTYQDGNCIAAENITTQNLTAEYTKAKTLLTNAFS